MRKCTRKFPCVAAAMDVATFVMFSAAIVPFVAKAGPYGPFAPDENYVVELDSCQGSMDVQQVHPPLGAVDFLGTNSEPQLRITMAGLSHYEAQVVSSEMPLSARVNVQVQATMPSDVGLDDAICHDLNRDGSTDFIVNLWGHGNGLGAESYNRLIALSTGDGYRFWVVPTMSPSAEDFVTFAQAEPLVMVTRAFVQKRDGQGEPRSYFVYDLWAFREGALVLANTVDSRFPKWVRYTLEPNWKPAVSLTEEDKRRLRSDPRPVEAMP